MSSHKEHICLWFGADTIANFSYLGYTACLNRLSMPKLRIRYMSLDIIQIASKHHQNAEHKKLMSGADMTANSSYLGYTSSLGDLICQSYTDICTCPYILWKSPANTTRNFLNDVHLHRTHLAMVWGRHKSTFLLFRVYSMSQEINMLDLHIIYTCYNILSYIKAKTTRNFLTNVHLCRAHLYII